MKASGCPPEASSTARPPLRAHWTSCEPWRAGSSTGEHGARRDRSTGARKALTPARCQRHAVTPTSEERMTKVTITFDSQLDQDLLKGFDTALRQLNTGHGPAWSRNGAIKCAMSEWLQRRSTASTVQASPPLVQAVPASTVQASPPPVQVSPASTVPVSTPPVQAAPASTVPVSTPPVQVSPSPPTPSAPPPHRGGMLAGVATSAGKVPVPEVQAQPEVPPAPPAPGTRPVSGMLARLNAQSQAETSALLAAGRDPVTGEKKGQTRSPVACAACWQAPANVGADLCEGCFQAGVRPARSPEHGEGPARRAGTRWRRSAAPPNTVKAWPGRCPGRVTRWPARRAGPRPVRDRVAKSNTVGPGAKLAPGPI